MTRLGRAFASPRLYVAWLVASALGLGAACAYDPYVFGFTAFGCLTVNGVLISAAPFFGARTFGLALLAALPTAAAFALLSTYRWA